MHTVITYKQIGGLAKQMQSRFREEQHQEIFLHFTVTVYSLGYSDYDIFKENVGGSRVYTRCKK